MAAKGDLFENLDALFTKKKLDGSPPFFIMHRFLASDPDFAIAARYLQRDVREPKMLLRTWQGILPRGKGAPRLSYVAPKKGPPAEALVTTMVRVLSERREVVEEIVAMFELQGKTVELYEYFGIEPEKAKK